jgi:hypothetical protein
VQVVDSDPWSSTLVLEVTAPTLEPVSAPASNGTTAPPALRKARIEKLVMLNLPEGSLLISKHTHAERDAALRGETKESYDNEPYVDALRELEGGELYTLPIPDGSTRRRLLARFSGAAKLLHLKLHFIHPKLTPGNIGFDRCPVGNSC